MFYHVRILSYILIYLDTGLEYTDLYSENHLYVRSSNKARTSEFFILLSAQTHAGEIKLDSCKVAVSTFFALDSPQKE